MHAIFEERRYLAAALIGAVIGLMTGAGVTMRLTAAEHAASFNTVTWEFWNAGWRAGWNSCVNDRDHSDTAARAKNQVLISGDDASGAPRPGP